MSAVFRGLLVFLAAIVLWAAAQETATSRWHDDALALAPRADSSDAREEGAGEETEQSPESDSEEDIDERWSNELADSAPPPMLGRIHILAEMVEVTVSAHVRAIFRPPRVDPSLRVEHPIRSSPVETRDARTERCLIT